MSAPVDPATPADETAEHTPALGVARTTPAASGPPPEDARAAERSASSAPPAAAGGPAPAAPPRPGVAPAADLQAQTVTIVIQLQPADGHPAGRPVLVSVRAGQAAPLFAAPLRYSTLGALPGTVTALLQQLQVRALEQRRKPSVPPPRPAASSAAPAPPPTSTTSAVAAALPAAPPAAPATNAPSTQLSMF